MKTTILTIFLMLQLIFIIFLYLRSKKKYIDKKDIHAPYLIDAKYLFPFLMIFYILKHDFRSVYEKKRYLDILYLSDSDKAAFLLRLFIAQKIFFAYLITLIFLLLNVFTTFDYTNLFLYIIAIILAFFLPDKKLEELKSKKMRKIRIEFFDYLNKLILLIGSGINITTAIYKAMSPNNKEGYFQREISLAINEINNGKTFISAFEDMALRCGVMEITSFTTTLIQNIKKGNSELLPILRLQSNSCRETRKNMARKLAEEASTKLLIPTSLMFVAILIIIVFPALMQFKI